MSLRLSHTIDEDAKALGGRGTGSGLARTSFAAVLVVLCLLKFDGHPMSLLLVAVPRLFRQFLEKIHNQRNARRSTNC